jgi:CMP-N,N'-diacetyllegionaminic acid synthase
VKALAIIPARGGSVRLPRKNLALIGGKTMTQHAVDCAHASGVCRWVVVSTDDEEIAAKTGNATIIRRPAHLADRELPMIERVRHIFEQAQDSIWKPGFASSIVLLQPTSPLREPEDVAACVRLMQETGADSVVSVTAGDVDTGFQIRHAKRLEPIKNIVVCNGAVYVLSVDHLLRGGDWYSGEAYGYVMPKERSVDVDTAADLEVARLLYARKAQGL